MKKIHLQLILSDVGQSNFKRLILFYTEKGGKTELFAGNC
jgi:hypothetical protein